MTHKDERTYRVWWREEFTQCKDQDQRDDAAWTVPASGLPCDDAEEAAEIYADYLYRQCDGWESTWPLEFVVHDGESYFVVEVDREFDPTFSASKAKPLVLS